MSAYTYTDQDHEILLVESNDHHSEVMLTISDQASFYIPNGKAPEIALSILEAARYNAMTEGPVGAAVSELRAHQFAVDEPARLADMEAEADRNALDAEAQRLYESAGPSHREDRIFAWSRITDSTKTYWRNVARAARRIYQDGAA